MIDDTVRHVLAFAVVGGFFGTLGVILFGLVDVREPTMAKIVGLVVGAFGAKFDVVLYRYFKTGRAKP